MDEEQRYDAPREGGEAAPKMPASPEPMEPELQRLADIPITVSVELDRKRIRLRDVLELRSQSVIKLRRSAGENVDLLVEGLRVANGEIVVIEDTMGLRVTDLAGSGQSQYVADDKT